MAGNFLDTSCGAQACDQPRFLANKPWKLSRCLPAFLQLNGKSTEYTLHTRNTRTKDARDLSQIRDLPHSQVSVKRD